MSFSTQAKDELARILPEKSCCQLAELAALVRMDGTINISAGHRIGLQVKTESAAVARKIFRLAKNLLNSEVEIRVQKRTFLRKTNLYHVHLLPNPGMSGFLKRLGVIKGDGSIFPGIKKSLVKSQCCRRSYLRGAFLGAGSVSSPEGNYHLEIITGDLDYAHSLAALINRFLGMQAKVSSRKRCHIVYLKESDQISAFLNIIGAHQALLNFENIRIIKGMRNQVNRLVNCETANLSKTVNASLKQVENIRFIDRVIGIDRLPSRLQSIARLRLDNPDASLKELGEMMDPPIGKSGVNHRMRRIEEISEELRSRFQT
ncbi:MAG: DNA-binding protein WhiA [Peptococcaceae bacterium]|jgi:DNA-binding protein WhiA|nr:DNA-binding protein WhiA [Peptococcaceae bacterium]MDH7524754.1 DNA-binding protein WhiA [Peptococcaceae bacterium]